MRFLPLGLALAFLSPGALGAQATGAPKDTVTTDGPTLLAFILLVPGEIDAAPSGDLAVIADDFSYYIGSALPAFDSLGIRVPLTLDSVIVLRSGGVPDRRFRVLGPDSIRVGYWLLGAGRSPRYLPGGVRSSADLIREACRHFDLPIPSAFR